MLDPDLTIRFANRSFLKHFGVAPEHTIGWKLYEIGNGQWDIPKFRTLLKTLFLAETIEGSKTVFMASFSNMPAGSGVDYLWSVARKV